MIKNYKDRTTEQHSGKTGRCSVKIGLNEFTILYSVRSVSTAVAFFLKLLIF